jgi:Ca-activated chloride channel family protein
MEIFNFLHLLCKFKRKTFNIMETTNYFKNTIKFSIVAFLIFLIASCYNGKTGENARQKYYATDAVEEADDGYAEMVKESEPMPKDFEKEDFNTESYDKINENAFVSTLTNPLSTFSVDVDRAAYANVRRFLEGNQLPPPDAVRIEEMVNYFNYNYPLPTGEHPFSVNLELANCPWNSEHQLISIGLKGKEIEINNVPSSNLVFLIDVSGSMSDPNKLPLLKQSFKILIEKLRSSDRVAMVVYAGAAGVVLPSTSCDEKDKIINAFDKLEAGGSTAGGEGIKLAYKIAKENFIDGGNNRVILATDGDFNIGASSDAAMERLIEEKREDGIFLTVLGFGMGNYKDSKMEKLSNAGNGNYAYIDNILEAKKTLGKEFFGTIYTIAKDVKLQIEFNPSKVKAYRLIGYENRMLNKEDFNDDKKDAGDIGAGHTVTALYEIIPAGSKEEVPGVDELEYQKTKVVKSDDIMTLKLRYKEPDASTSKLIKHKITEEDLKKDLSTNFKWAVAVTEFGLLLRDSQFKGKANFENVIAMAKEAKGSDPEGYRAEFIKLAEVAELLKK